VTRANKEAGKYKDDPASGKDVPKPDEGKVRAATRDAQNAESAQTSAQSDVTTASNALDAAKKMAEDARKMREEAAGEAKRKLDEASDAGIQNRKWYEEVGDWVSDNWDIIVAVCKVVVAVVGIIAMIIGGPILGAIVLIAALVVLADTLNKYVLRRQPSRVHERPRSPTDPSDQPPWPHLAVHVRRRGPSRGRDRLRRPVDHVRTRRGRPSGAARQPGRAERRLHL
jgi:hypothetical protein